MSEASRDVILKMLQALPERTGKSWAEILEGASQLEKWLLMNDQHVGLTTREALRSELITQLAADNERLRGAIERLAPYAEYMGNNGFHCELCPTYSERAYSVQHTPDCPAVAHLR